MAKIDIAHAYRNVPMHPTDRYLLGMQWKNEIYMDAALPFGLRSAPKILCSKGIAPSTNGVYSSAQRIFLDFCTRLNLAPIPAPEATLILFATELAQTRAQYLAGVRHRPACNQQAGKPSEWNAEAGPGAKRHPQDKAHGNQKQVRLPVTPNILSRIRGVLDRTTRAP